MDAMRKGIVELIELALAAIFVMFAVICGSLKGSICFVIAAFLIIPIRFVREYLQEKLHLKHWMIFVFAVILFFIAIAFTGADANYQTALLSM